MLNRDSPIPLYVQIKEYIRQNIRSGVYQENCRIPSERQLAEHFNVNRLTVNKALSEMVQDGILNTHVGKGTFVSPQKIDQELRSLTSFTEDMTQRGKRSFSQVLHAGVEAADQDVANLLRILPGAEVMVLTRVRLADGEAVSLETSTVIATMCPNILNKHDFSKESLYQVLREEYGLHLTHAEQTMVARRATPNEIEALSLERDDPILGITRISYSEENQPVEYVRSAYRGDLYKFRAVLRRSE